MKIRQIPEDFQVEEISNQSLIPDGEYNLFRMKKRDLDTFWCLNHIARIKGVPRRDIGFGGLKDRRAVTIQYLTTPKKYDITLKQDNIQVTLIGSVANPLLLGNLAKNHFKIVIRDIKPKEARVFTQKHKIIKVPNYFDSQRFGGIHFNQARTQPKFIFRDILKKNYYNAMRLYLTHYSPGDSQLTHDDKQQMRKVWPDVSKVKVESLEFQKIIKKYKESNDWEKAYGEIDYDQKKFHKSALLSYLWNECIQELIKRSVKAKDLIPKKYECGNFVFSGYYPPDLPKIFHTIGKADQYTPLEKEIIQKVLQKEDLQLEQFQEFESQERLVLLQPDQYTQSKVSADQMNSKGKNTKMKIALSFDLPPGSYATLIAKFFGVTET